MRYVNEAQVPIAGSKIPISKFGVPIPGASSEVGSGARQTYLATKKPIVRALEKRLLQWLAFDLAHKTASLAGDAAFKAKQYYEQFQYVVDHPEETKEDIREAVPPRLQNYFPGSQSK